MSNWFWMLGSNLKFARKLMAMGATTKYPKATPLKNNTETQNTAPRAAFNSLLFKPGLMKRHNSWNM